MSGDASRGRSGGQRTCDPQGCRTLAPTPDSCDYALCRKSTGETVQGLWWSKLLCPWGRAPTSLFSGVVPASPAASSLGDWERSQPHLSHRSWRPLGPHTHYSLLATGGRPKPCILWLWCPGGGQCPPWRPGCHVVSHHPGLRALWKLREAERTAGAGEGGGG